MIPPQKTTESKPQRLRTVGLFAGVGGIERGLAAAGHATTLLCEVDPAAQRVLATRFPNVPLHDDITTLDALPACDLLAAGFPCQDLSQAGRTAGIGGSQSGLVGHVFRLLDDAHHEVQWVLLENVPFMLQLERGEAMSHLVRELDRRGFNWAYRVIDTRSFGLPQRRKRVILLASRTEDPRPVLFGEEADPTFPEPGPDSWHGFYWTEGLRGLGWAVDAVPTLKGGSTVGIPSPPAIWIPENGQFVTPDLRDAERLQGFAADWTAPATDGRRRNGPRWKLVGNAVSVPVARWVGERLSSGTRWTQAGDARIAGGSWPAAAWGGEGEAFTIKISSCPRMEPYTRLREFLAFEPHPLSQRAAAGFLARLSRSSLRVDPAFRAAVQRYVRAAEKPLSAAA